MRYFTAQELENAVRKAPKPVQEIISSRLEVAGTIAEISKKHQLQLDQIGLLAELNRNMLLGLVSPEELLGELILAKVSDVQARGVISDINEKIFVPLRAQMQGGAAGAPQMPAPVASAPQPVRPATPPVPQPRVVVPAPNYAPPRPPAPPAAPVVTAPATPPAPPRPAPQPAPQQWANQWAPPSTVIQANPSLPQRPAQIADSMMHYTPFPKPSTPRAVPLRSADAFQANRAERITAPVRSAPVAQRPTMGSDRMLEDHEEPSPQMRQPSGVIQPGARAPIARVAQPPANLPGAMPPRPVSYTAPAPTPRPGGVDHYSMDPYREPLEDTTVE
ncbi:MAG: hypothetical protein RLZZ26_337 [Candidatus Parcubacteria bacterium]|jgi:hypothetical protein